MNELMRFDFGNKSLRTMLLNGEPWFVAKDVCDVLEIVNSRDAVARLDDDEKGVVSTDTHGGDQILQVINEPGLYTLVLGSRKPEAKAFKRWITHEVIPEIRKTGTYSLTPKSPGEMFLEMAKQYVVQEQRMNRLEIQMQVTQNRIDNLDSVNVIGDKQQRLNAMIRKLAQQEGWTFQKAWREFTNAFNVAFHTNLTQRVENYRERHGLKDLTRPQYLSLVEQLDDAIRVADKMLNRVPA